MLHPVTHSWHPSTSTLTGLGFNPQVYARTQHIAPRVRWRPRSLGDATIQQQIGVASSVASTAGSAIALAVGATAAIPLIGTAIAGAAEVAILISKMFSGCGETCVQASNIANQVGNLLQQNLDSYLKLPVHYQSVQRYYLMVFDGAWAQLLKACGNPALAQAGQRCITDRQAGACTWKNKAGGWQQNTSGGWTYVPPGAKDSGTDCWNWFIGLRDPIANDPTVVPDPPGLVINPDGTVTVPVTNAANVPGNAVTMTAQQAASLGGPSIPMPLLLGGGLLVLLLVMGAGS